MTLYATAESSIEALANSTAAAEDVLAARSGPTPPKAHDEYRCWSDLKKEIADVSKHLKIARSTLTSASKALKNLEPEETSLLRERHSTLRTMASGHMSRVGAPCEAVSEVRTIPKDSCEEAMMDVIQYAAPPECFTNLYEEVRNGHAAWPDWICSPEAAVLPERDLLGMCPGGKPHLLAEELKKRKETRCFCSICIINGRLTPIQPQIVKLRGQVADARDVIREAAPVLRRARKALKRLRKGDDDNSLEEKGDPVFSNEGYEPEDEEAFIAQRIAQQEWGRLQSTLRVEDFPLRIAFLDKSGSMGCDEVTYDALQLGLHNCLHPTAGATLTFLFAGPGETQIVLRRPSDPPVEFNVELGCATWFNEPIMRTLTFLAPVLEALDVQQWIVRNGMPPVQVLCMTDGFDNCSPSNLNTLTGLVNELKEITGPASGEQLYMPIAGPVSKHKALLDEKNKKIPVWMAWIAVGIGGQMMLKSKTPKEVCIIDAVAVPRLRELDAHPGGNDVEKQHSSDEHHDESSSKGAQQATVASRARKRMSAIQSGQVCDAVDAAEASRPSWSIGHRVRVRAPEPGRAPKSATVLRVVQEEAQPLQYELLFDDESQATVAESQLCGAPACITPLIRVRKDTGVRIRGAEGSFGMLSRTAEPDMQRLQVLSVVKLVTSDLAAVMGSQDPKTGKVSLEGAVAAANAGAEEIDEQVAEALEAQLSEAREATNVTSVVEMPPCDPTQALLDALMKVGSSAARMLPEDRVVAQRLVAAGMEMMMYGGSLMPNHLVDQLGHFADIMQERATRRMKTEPEEIEAWYKELSGPLQTLLLTLSNLDMIETRQTPDGEILQARHEARLCFAMLRRFFEPGATRSGVEDALRRCVNRCQRLRPALRASITKTDLPNLPSPPQRQGSKESAQTVCGDDFRPPSEVRRRSKPRPPASCGTSTWSPQAANSGFFQHAPASPASCVSQRGSLPGLDFLHASAGQRAGSSSMCFGESFSPGGFTRNTSTSAAISRLRSRSLGATGMRMITPVR
jgi:hypothetical protein